MAAERGPEQMRVGEGEVDVCAGGGTQAGGRISIRRHRHGRDRHRLLEHREPLQGNGRNERVLVGEVVVRGTGAHADLGGE